MIIKISLYKKPFSILLSSFVPLYMLALLLLGIYFQSYSYDSRISSIGVVLLAYIAYLPTLRSMIPPVDYFTLSDFVLILHIISCFSLFLCSLL